VALAAVHCSAARDGENSVEARAQRFAQDSTHAMAGRPTVGVRGPHGLTTPTGDLRGVGKAGTLREYLRPFRLLDTGPTAAAPPKVRQITGWLLRHHDSLDADDQSSSMIYGAVAHTWMRGRTRTAFADMLTNRHGERLDTRIKAVEADEPSPLVAG
jgi:hypothetical protein